MQSLPRKRYNDENRDHILRYVEAGGEGNEEGIIISDKQSELLLRWRFAAEKLWERKYKRRQIANFIKATFEISLDTAWKDIVNAEYIFSASFPFNKQFKMQNRIELLEQKINECYLASDYFNAAQLEKILQKYILEYPDAKPIRSPKNIIFNVQNNGNTLMVTNMTAEQALSEADDMINKLEENEDY